MLNRIRKDIKQEYQRKVTGDKPVIIVGEIKKAYLKAKELCENEEVYTLSRRNVTANFMKEEFDDISIGRNIIDELKSADSNYIRQHTIISCISAVE